MFDIAPGPLRRGARGGHGIRPGEKGVTGLAIQFLHAGFRRRGAHPVLNDRAGVAGDCPGDTTIVEVKVIQPFHLGNDTTICYDDLLTLSVPPGLTDWHWSDGSNRPDLRVATPGTYGLSGNIGACSFADSVRVDFYTCKACAFYTPNVFSPNDDGVNDLWQVFLPCAWQQFKLEIYDRWGSLVFASDDPEKGWDGRTQGREPLQGVYVWRLEWTGELFGVPKKYSKEGDVTVVR